jgi:hypothetical protein
MFPPNIFGYQDQESIVIGGQHQQASWKAWVSGLFDGIQTIFMRCSSDQRLPMAVVYQLAEYRHSFAMLRGEEKKI